MLTHNFYFPLWEKVTNNNQQKEYYLTDIVEIACREGVTVKSFIASDYVEVMGINTLEELSRAGKYLQNNRKYPD